MMIMGRLRHRRLSHLCVTQLTRWSLLSRHLQVDETKQTPWHPAVGFNRGSGGPVESRRDSWVRGWLNLALKVK